MKKVALVNVFFPPQTIGGATRVLSDNIDGLLSSYSEDVELVGFTTQSDCRAPYNVDVYTYKGFRVYRANCNFRENMDWFAEDKEFYKIFSDFIDFEKPDIIHFHCVQRMSASVVEAAKDKSIPYVVTIHDAWWISDFQFLVDHKGNIYPEGHPDPFEDREFPNNVSPVESLERSTYLKGLLRAADKILHVSSSFDSLYQKNGIDRSLIIGNGISSNVEWLNKDTGYTSRVVLGHIGGMSDHKGYDVFISALKAADPEYVEGLVVDHSREPFYESVQYFGNVKVTFVGRQDQNKIVDLYRKIDVLFAPSKWPESFGLVTREAAACGCWVVASCFGGIGEDVQDSRNGFVIEPTAKEASRVISLIESDHAKYKGLAPSSRLRYSDQQVKELVEKVYL